MEGKWLSRGGKYTGLNAIVRPMTEAVGTLDKDGWLRPGIAGHQTAVKEGYISTGLLHLGLLVSDPFLTAPAEDWTQKRLWAGENIPADDTLK